MIVRPTLKTDLSGLKEVIDSSELFPSEYLDEMISDYLDNPESEDIWFSCIEDDTVIGFGYCVPEMLTDGTYNLLAIAVRKQYQGNGIGTSMVRYLEEFLKKQSKRILIIETSSAPQYQQTRTFYHKLNYTLEGTLRDFWKEGEDKVTYWKKLG